MKIFITFVLLINLSNVKNISNSPAHSCNFHSLQTEIDKPSVCGAFSVFMAKEIWKSINGFDRYFVSSVGRVKSLPNKTYSTTRILKSWTYIGYKYVMLPNRHKYLVHRLVAQQFIPNPENKPYVNHKNGVRDDNRLCNLEWVTAHENSKHATTVLGSSKNITYYYGGNHHSARAIKGYDSNGREVYHLRSIIEAAKLLGGNRGTICKALAGRCATAFGYVWKYV